MDPQLEAYREQFEQIAQEARSLISGLSEAEFNRRPGPGEWSVEECLSHLISVGAAQAEVMEQAIAAARTKGITGTGPFEYPALERIIIRESDAPVRHALPAPKRFQPIHGQPVTAVLPTFLHIQRQFTQMMQRADGLDLRRVRVPVPQTRLIKFSLGGTIEVVAAHERRHMAQARRALARIKPTT